jgi:hypothetical protein
MKLNIGKALNPVADDPGALRKIGIFAAIVLASIFFSWLVIPGLLLPLYLGGYLMKYTRNVATDDEGGRLPDPTNWESLWHGLVLTFIYILYCLPLLGVMFVGLGGAVMALLSGAKGNAALATVGGIAGAGVFGLVSLLLAFAIWAFAPMVSLQYCKRFQFADAFDFGSIISGMMRSPLDYLVVLLVPFGLSAVVSFVPLVNLILMPFLSIVACNLIGQYGREVLEMGGSSSSDENVGFNRF